MRKLAAVLAAVILTAAVSGCAADEFSGNTQQSYSGASAEETAGTSAEIPEETVETAEPAGEEYHETTEPAAESAPTADPVRLAEGFSAEYLGLPDSGKVYIFRDKGETVQINGAECPGVSCYDEVDGQLEFICDFYFSPDGGAAYRFHPEDGSYRPLPEQGDFPGFDPESQSPEEVFRQANALYAAVYGELDFDSSAEPVAAAAGNFYPVSDERLDTEEKLHAALSQYFAGDILAKLLEGSDRVMTAEDGRLYCLEHYGGAQAPTVEYSAADITEDSAVYSCTALYEYEAGNTTRQEFTCTAERNQAGEWRFTDFTFPGM